MILPIIADLIENKPMIPFIDAIRCSWCSAGHQELKNKSCSQPTPSFEMLA